MVQLGLSSDLNRQLIQVTFQTDSQARNQIDVAIGARSRNAAEATLNMYAKNHTTGQFDLISTPTFSQTYQLQTFSNLDGSKYVSATREIVIRISNKVGVDDGSRNNPPTADIDIVRVIAHN